MAVRVVTDRGVRLRLGRRVDNGGQGVVYEVDGKPGRVAKLLLRPRDPAAARRRLASLVRHGRSPRTMALLTRAAWPTAAVTTTDLGIEGYLMRDLRTRFEPLDCLLVAQQRATSFPAATWATSLAAAANLAALVADLHAAGYVVGDMKRENLWADEHGNVAISDVDSFQFSDVTGFYPCTSRTPGYSAPECIGVAEPRFDEWSDRFVLAVLVHELLMDGLHPFSGQPGDGACYVSLDDNVAHGRTRVVSAEAVLLRPEAPPLSLLPSSLRQLLQRCFDDAGRIRPATRPSAAQWRLGLGAAAAPSELTRCDRTPGHVHAAEARECPWCALAAV